MIDIANIERFATHDGPGIRTTVFLKGCTLTCPWCANPETQSRKPTLLYDAKACVLCHQCENNCPKQAIHFDDTGFHHDDERCITCFQCEQNCLQKAITFSGLAWSAEDVIKEVLKDEAYYRNSQGGVTFSGGEPFVQWEGLCELLQLAKRHGLHTAVETTGNYPLSLLQQADPYIDLYLYDFKHMDDERLYAVTKGNGKRIKENLMYLLKKDASSVIVRMPIIPDFHADMVELRQELKYLKAIGVQEVHLLPYHSLGKPKYEQMQRTYSFPSNIMSRQELEPLCAYARSLNMKAQIGG